MTASESELGLPIASLPQFSMWLATSEAGAARAPLFAQHRPQSGEGVQTCVHW